MSDVIRMIQLGLGCIGCATARLVHERESGRRHRSSEDRQRIARGSMFEVVN